MIDQDSDNLSRPQLRLDYPQAFGEHKLKARTPLRRSGLLLPRKGCYDALNSVTTG